MNDELTILYVEDNNDIAEEILFFLEFHYKNVLSATNGAEGLELFKKHHPDMIISDIQMPIMNGIEMISHIKKIHSDIPVIITTAFNDSEYLSKAIDLQVNGYVLKPINLKQLLQTMQKVTEPFLLKKQLIEKNKEYETLNQNLEFLVENKTLELKKNLALLNSYKFALDISSIVSITDKNGIITYVNNNFCKISGYSQSELIGNTHNMVKSPNTTEHMIKRMWDDILTKKRWQGIIKNQKKDHSHYWINLSIIALLDEENNTLHYISISTDITKTMDQKEILYKAANIDTLTGLFNRNKLLSDIKTSPSALALINIKKFRQINDFYGFAFGDKVITSFAQFLSKCTHINTITLYRLHADEFAILSKDKNNIIPLLNTIIEEVSHSFMIDDISIKIDLAISVSFEKENLLRTADIIKKEHKSNSTNLIIYNKQMNLEKKIEEDLTWIEKIKTAYNTNNFIPYYQPIVNNQTLQWEKAESLVRMVDEKAKVYTPFFFLNMAKQTKYYIHITKKMIQSTFQYFQNREESFSINLAIKDIVNHETQEFILDQLSHYENSKHVIFEIEESEGVECYDEIISFIHKLKSFGCKIAIDDFGSGYSNFEYLVQFQADFIKIDGSIIKDIATNETSKIVTKNIVRFAKDLGIQTIAEFVENKEIFDIVKQLGVDYSQGYYFSKPTADLDENKLLCS